MNNNQNNNNSIFSPDPQGYAQPRSNGHRNTTYYSPTKNFIHEDKEDEKDGYNFIFDSNESYFSSVLNDDETEKKRKKGWEIIYDIANGSNQNITTDDTEKSLDDSIKENNSDQNGYSRFNNENDDDSDISID